MAIQFINDFSVTGNATFSTTGVTDNIVLTSTDTSASSAPDLVLYRNAAVANSDTLGVVEYKGKNGMVPSLGTPLTYNAIYSRIADASNNQSILTFSAHKGNGSGSFVHSVNVSAIGTNNSATGAILINPTSEFKLPAYNLDVNGDAYIASDATIIGNVGIGASPGDKLHVEGNIYLGASSRTIYTGGSGNLTFQNGTGNMLFLRSNGSSESMRIDSSGNVTMTGALTVNAKFTANDVDKHAPSVVYDADAGQVLKNEDSELAIGLGSVYPTSVNYPLWVQGRKNDDTARNICLQPVGGSVQIGVDNFNADKGSLATGYENEINGKFSFATGKTNVLGTSEATAAIGRLNEVAGLGSTAIGSNNTVTKKATVVIGSGNTANHENNFILGFANTTQKIQSIAVGRFNNLNSGKIVSVGHNNTSSGTTDNATSFGYLNESLHSNSHLFGQGLESSQAKEIIIGKFNAPPSNPTGTGTRNANVIIAVGTGEFAGATMNAVEYYGFNDGSMQVIHKALLNASSYANDTAAAAGGVPIGGLYRHNNDVKIRLT